MRRNIYNAIYYCLLGVFLIMIAMLALIQQEKFLLHAFVLLGIILIVNSLYELSVFYRRHFKGSLLQIIINLAGGILIILFPDIPIRLLLIIFALYITLNGIIKFICYLNYKKDRVSYRLHVLVGSLFLIINGLALLGGNYMTYQNIMFFISGYGILLGVNYIIDAIFIIIPQQQRDSLKRRFRIPLPLFISALLPKVMMDHINECMKKRIEEYEIIEDKEANIEIWIHVSDDGFGTVGHCDICIDEQVISYGNYDRDSISMFEAIGDGVLFIAPRDRYLKFCIETYQQTIFSYNLKLTIKQLNSVKREIERMMKHTYSWFPRAYYENNYCKDYASKVYLATKAAFFKFKAGRFKTYFVLGSNCVKLVEKIMGKGGLDIIDLNGIIAPGTYQTYLEKEFQRLNGLKKKKNIYNRLTKYPK